MIGVSSQYILKVSLGDSNDFITQNNLVRFALVSETGNVLPTFELIFKSHDDDILSYINEGNRLSVSIGADIDSIVTVPLVIVRKNIGKYGEDSRRLELSGVLDALGYFNGDNSFSSDKKSGVQVVKDVVEKYFRSDFNINSSSDLQNWVQYSTTDRNFVNDTYMHSWHPSSFFATAITSDNVFRLYDMKKKLLEGYKWKFVSHVEDATKDIEYGGYFPIDIIDGVTNNIGGYGSERSINNLETGVSETQSESVETFIATGSLDRNSAVSKKVHEIRAVNSNVHENYWKAYDRNKQYLLTYSSHQVSLVFPSVFKHIHPLDIVMFTDGAVGEAVTAEHHAGLYIVQKVAINIVGNMLSTIVELTRESSNKNIGDLL